MIYPLQHINGRGKVSLQERPRVAECGPHDKCQESYVEVISATIAALENLLATRKCVRKCLTAL